MADLQDSKACGGNLSLGAGVPLILVCVYVCMHVTDIDMDVACSLVRFRASQLTIVNLMVTPKQVSMIKSVS